MQVPQEMRGEEWVEEYLDRRDDRQFTDWFERKYESWQASETEAFEERLADALAATERPSEPFVEASRAAFYEDLDDRWSDEGWAFIRAYFLADEYGLVVG